MITQILAWIANVGQVFLVLSVIIWIINYFRFPKAVQILGYYLILNAIIQLVAYLLWKDSQNNLYLLHLNTFLEFVCISLFFREVYVKQDYFKSFGLYFILGICIFLIFNSMFWEPTDGFNTRAKVVVQVILITYVIIYFFDAYGKVDLAQTDAQAVSLICFGILLYNSGSLFVFMFSEFSSLADVRESYRIIWMINGVLTFLFQLIILIAFLKLNRFGRSSDPSLAGKVL